MKKGLLIIGIVVVSLICSCAIFIDDDDDDNNDCAFHDDTDSINITIYSNYPMLP